MYIPTVKWSLIELPKELGGLGVGNIMHKNLILLFKWWWRFSESDNTLWKRILMSVYEIKGLKASSDVFIKVKDGIWSQMLSDDVGTSKIRTIIEEGMLLNVGCGDSILFWHDRWCEAGPLKGAFPRLFTLSLQKNLFINKMDDWNEGTWSWNIRWRRVLYDWKNEEVLRLENLIEQKMPRKKTADGVYWRASGNYSFPSKSIVDKVYESSVPILSKPIINTIWQNCVPPEHN